MRLDKFLKVSRLVKQRQHAKELCDSGAIVVNGAVAKPACEINPGDILEVIRGDMKFKAEILEIPRGNVSKKDAGTLVEILERSVLDACR